MFGSSAFGFKLFDEVDEVSLGFIGVGNVLLHVVGQLLVFGHRHKLLGIVKLDGFLPERAHNLELFLHGGQLNSE